VHRFDEFIQSRQYLRNVTAKTVAWYRDSFRSFERFHSSEEGHSSDLLRIPPLKTEKKILATFSRSQVDAFLRSKPKTFSGFRLHALVALLLDTGLRIEEALGPQKAQPDLENLLVKVKGKGERNRIVPMSFELREALFRWLVRYEFSLVFPTLQGWRLTRRNLLRDLSSWGKSSVSFHAFRHTFAVNYLRAGGNLFYLSKILGIRA
jgi:integrase/recombinase XerD